MHLLAPPLSSPLFYYVYLYSRKYSSYGGSMRERRKTPFAVCKKFRARFRNCRIEGERVLFGSISQLTVN